jgi:hypothetical protein
MLKEMAMPKGKGMEIELEMAPSDEGSEEMGMEEPEMGADGAAVDLASISDEDLMREAKARGLV